MFRALMSLRKAGVLFSVGAYGIWGLLPLYLKAVASASPTEVLAHRVFWSAVFLLAIVLVRRRYEWLSELRRKSVLLTALATTLLLSVNWYVYIWAVSAGRVIDASLGYFINPLVTVVLGVVSLGERLRRVQWLAVAIAAAGVIWLTIYAGQLPWIGLVLASSFAIYGWLRKTARLGALEGLMLETLLLSPVALGMIVFSITAQRSMFIAGGDTLRFLLLLGGPITAVPLLLFAAGARRIPLSLVGVLQYIAPSMQLMIGAFVFGEALRPGKLLGFALIWLALAIYSVESIWSSRQRPLLQTV